MVQLLNRTLWEFWSNYITHNERTREERRANRKWEFCAMVTNWCLWKRKSKFNWHWNKNYWIRFDNDHHEGTKLRKKICWGFRSFCWPKPTSCRQMPTKSLAIHWIQSKWSVLPTRGWFCRQEVGFDQQTERNPQRNFFLGFVPSWSPGSDWDQLKSIG